MHGLAQGGRVHPPLRASPTGAWRSGGVTKYLRAITPSLRSGQRERGGMVWRRSPLGGSESPLEVGRNLVDLMVQEILSAGQGRQVVLACPSPLTWLPRPGIGEDGTVMS